MSVLEDEASIATRLRQIQEDRATAMGLTLPPTFGKLDAPPKVTASTSPELLGVVLFDMRQSWFLSRTGGAQVIKLAQIVEQVQRRDITSLRIQGHALDGESPVDSFGSPEDLARKRARFVAGCIRDAMLFMGNITCGDVTDEHIHKCDPSGWGDYRRVEIFAA